MKKKDNLFHHSACISLLLLTLLVFRPDIGFCTAPTLEWVGYYGLWNDGVRPDYGTTSTEFTFKVIYTDTDTDPNQYGDPPGSEYPKVHILQGGTAISGSPFTMTQDSCGGVDCDGKYNNGERYLYTTTLSPAGNDYTYYFEAKDSNEDIAGFSSPTNEHTLTVVTDYIWVDYDTGSNPDNSDCTDVGVPYPCCTGLDTGTCDSLNSDCTDVDVPYGCCTGAGTGNCTVDNYCISASNPYPCCTGDETGTCAAADGSQGEPYQTIAYGISHASPGEAVRVLARSGSPPGEYEENFTMADGVHVVSDNSNNGDNEDTYNDPYSDHTTSMLKRTGRTIIKGFITFPSSITTDVVIDGFTVYMNCCGKAIMDINTNSPIIRNNIVKWSTVTGTSILEMEAASGTHEAIIENNLIHQVNTRGISVGARISALIQDNEIWAAATYPGIGLNRKGVPGGEITILNNDIFACGGPGIGTLAIAKNTTVTIQGNDIHDNGFDSSVSGKPLGAGIYLARGGSTSADETETLEIIIGGPDPGQGNQIYNSTLAGIRLDSNGGGFFPVLIQNNDIYDNGKAGMLLFDVGYYRQPSGPGPPPPVIVTASILDNNIYGNTKAGINIGGETFADITYNAIYNNYAGIAFDMASVVEPPATSNLESFGTVNIEDNDIYSNTMAGIAVRDAIDDDTIHDTNVVTIAGNDIYQNDRGGIGIINSCKDLVINRNDINNNVRGGIHTGTDVADDYFAGTDSQCTGVGTPYPCCTGLGTGTCESSGGFIGTADSALLEVSQNKVYQNGLNSYGGGVDLRHASGTILNNLIYENRKGGIRFGDYIDEIVNNTVADNGHVAVVDENDCTDVGVPYTCCTGEDVWTCTYDNSLCVGSGDPYTCCTGVEEGSCTSLKFGGGIIYDNLGGNVNDQAGGDGPSIPIRNNISAFHASAGIRTGDFGGVCPSGDYRDYNLLFGNNNTPIDVSPITWPPWKMRPQLGGCLWNANEVFADPEFEDRDNDDYRIQVTSLAVDTGDAGYDLNTDCTDVGVPYPCCTGVGEGTCPTYDYGDDVSIPPGVGTYDIDMGAYGGPSGIDW